MNEIAKPNTANIAEALKDRIRLELLDVIPQDTWKAMLLAETKAFLEGPPVRNDAYYNGQSRQTTSGFQDIVRHALENELKKRMAEYFGTPEWRMVWDSTTNQMVPGAMLQKAISDAAPGLMQAFFTSAATDIVTAMIGRR
jgi:hypothetical protein